MRYEKTAVPENKWMATLKALLLGFCVGAVVCTLLLVLFSLAFVGGKLLPLNLLRPLTLVACMIGSFAGGYFAAKKRKEQGMFYGLLTGLLLFGILAFISAIKTGQSFTFYALVAGIAMALLGAIGGILGVNKRSRRK